MTGDSIQTGDIQGVGIAIGTGASITSYGDVHYYPIVLRAPLREVFDPLIEDRVRLFGGRADMLDQIMRRVQEPGGGYTTIFVPRSSPFLATAVPRSTTCAWRSTTPYHATTCWARWGEQKFRSRRHGLAAFMSHGHPAQFGCDVEVRCFQMGHIAAPRVMPSRSTKLRRTNR